MSEQVLLVRTFVHLADTLVRDYDVIDVLTTLAHRCGDLFGGQAGIMLADHDGQLHTAGSSSDRVHQVELFELQQQQGPCPEAFRHRRVVIAADLADAVERWPQFAPEALDAGFRAAYAVPMRLRDEAVGAINLLSPQADALTPDDLVAAQALADVATIAILQQRAARDAGIVIGQLHEALHSRITIEQAKGIVAQVLDLDMDAAFVTIRAHARRHQRLLADVARDLTTRTLTADQLAS